MAHVARQMWAAIRPIDAQQRFLRWCATALLVSGLVHAVVALVDGSSWWGPVSWRKPVVFGFSFGLLLWSGIWILRQLPPRRFGWPVVVVLGGASVAEVALITMQRWRGVPSHFNNATLFDRAVISAMGNLVALVVLSVAALLVWSLVDFSGGAGARVAVVVGLAGALAGGAVGGAMVAVGEAQATATGEVPSSVVFGAQGSAKLAHFAGMHGLQLLGLLTAALGLGPLSARARWWLVVLAAAGYGAVFGSVTATAVAGRGWTAPTAPMALLGAGGLLLISGGLLAAAWSLRYAARHDAPRPVVVVDAPVC